MQLATALWASTILSLSLGAVYLSNAMRVEDNAMCVEDTRQQWLNRLCVRLSPIFACIDVTIEPIQFPHELIDASTCTPPILSWASVTASLSAFHCVVVYHQPLNFRASVINDQSPWDAQSSAPCSASESSPG